MSQKYAGADWLKSNVQDVSPIGLEVADILGQVFQGIYHIDDAVLKKTVQWNNKYWIEIVLHKDLATFDFNELTSLVILCHDRMIRLDITGVKSGYIKLIFHKRKYRHGIMAQRMPFLEEHIELIRESVGLPILEGGEE